MSIETQAVSDVHAAASSFGSGMFALFFILGALFLYNLPWIIALKRKLPNTLSIFLLDFFLGWSFIGWVVALIWACSNTENKSPININLNNKGDIK